MAKGRKMPFLLAGSCDIGHDTRSGISLASVSSSCPAKVLRILTLHFFHVENEGLTSGGQLDLREGLSAAPTIPNGSGGGFWT